MLRKAMIIILSVLGLVLVLGVISKAKPTEPIQLSNDITIAEINTGVYLVIHKIPFGRMRIGCNSMLIRVSDRNFIWCDTTYEPESTALVYNWITDNFGDVNLIEINTGFHADNLGGNQFLLSKDIPVYGSDITARLIHERGREEKEKLIKSFSESDNSPFHRSCRRMTFMPPSHIFDANDGLRLEISDEVVEVYYPGPTHTLDNVVVYFHKRKILFGGCMIKSLNSKNAGYTSDADMQEWPRSVEKVLAKYQNAAIVVPGHGDSGNISLLKHTIELLDEINN